MANIVVSLQVYKKYCEANLVYYECLSFAMIVFCYIDWSLLRFGTAVENTAGTLPSGEDDAKKAKRAERYVSSWLSW